MLNKWITVSCTYLSDAKSILIKCVELSKYYKIGMRTLRMPAGTPDRGSNHKFVFDEISTKNQN